MSHPYGTQLEESQREIIAALRAQVSDLREWLTECKKERAKMFTEEQVRSAVAKALRGAR